MKNPTLAASLLACGLFFGATHQVWSNPPELKSDSGSEETFDLSQAKLIDRIIATVNDDIILQSQLNNRLVQTRQEMMARRIPLPDLTTLQQKVLDSMILEEVQVQRAKQLGLSIPDEAVLPKLNEVAQKNNLSLEQLRLKLNQMEANGFETFREQVRTQLLIQKLREEEVISKTQVTEDEINHYLQRQTLKQENYEYHLGHIMISLPDSATPAQREEAKQKAEHLRQLLRQGEDFGQIAVRYSNGSQALNGGDLGWLESGQIPTFFSEVIPHLQIGDLSDVIRSPVGFHIIKLEGKRLKGGETVSQYHLHRFLLLSDDAKYATAPPDSIVKLTQSLHSLADFEKLKTEYADMPTEINRTTDLGWIDLKHLAPELATPIQALRPNQAVALATEEGWAIVYLEAQREANPDAGNERQKAMQTLKLKKANETFDIWLRRLKEEAVISLQSDKEAE